MQPKRGEICDFDLDRRPLHSRNRARIIYVGAGITRPPSDPPPQAVHPQSEALFGLLFLSSPILSFARKRKNGKKKKRVPYVGFLLSQEDADAALGPVSFLCLARKILERKNRFPCQKGFLAPSPRVVVHSVHFSAPWAVVGDRGRSQAKIEACALFLCHSEPVRTPVRNLIVPGKISHQFENFRNDRTRRVFLVGAGVSTARRRILDRR